MEAGRCGQSKAPHLTSTTAFGSFSLLPLPHLLNTHSPMLRTLGVLAEEYEEGSANLPPQLSLCFGEPAQVVHLFTSERVPRTLAFVQAQQLYLHLSGAAHSESPPPTHAHLKESKVGAGVQAKLGFWGALQASVSFSRNGVGLAQGVFTWGHEPLLKGMQNYMMGSVASS